MRNLPALESSGPLDVLWLVWNEGIYSLYNPCRICSLIPYYNLHITLV